MSVPSSTSVALSSPFQPEQIDHLELNHSKLDHFEEQIRIALDLQNTYGVHHTEKEIEGWKKRLYEYVDSLDEETFSARKYREIQDQLRQLKPSLWEQITNTDLRVCGLTINSSDALTMSVALITGCVGGIFYGLGVASLSAVHRCRNTVVKPLIHQTVSIVREPLEGQFPSAKSFLDRVHNATKPVLSPPMTQERAVTPLLTAAEHLSESDLKGMPDADIKALGTLEREVYTKREDITLSDVEGWNDRLTKIFPRGNRLPPSQAGIAERLDALVRYLSQLHSKLK